MNFKDCALIQRHVTIVAALKRDQVARLDNVWLREVFELYVLVLQVEVTQLARTATLTPRGALREVTS